MIFVCVLTILLSPPKDPFPPLYPGEPDMQSIPFEPHKSARFTDSALKKSVGAMEQAQQCAVLWFGEIMRRKLY